MMTFVVKSRFGNEEDEFVNLGCLLWGMKDG